MPADPVAAGRKGGKSRSEKKLAAARRNGFQKPAPALVQESTPEPVPNSDPKATVEPTLFAPRKEQ